MLPVYVFAAIVGAGLLLFGMFGGDHEHGGDHDFHVPITGGDHDLQWSKMLSLRTLAYVLAAFGLSGTGLALVGAPPLTGLLLATAMAVVGGAGIGLLFGWLQSNQGGFGESSDRYIGGLARTEIRIPTGGRGRIQLLHAGRSFTLPAVSEAGEIDRQQTVIVIDVVDGVAVVSPAPDELAG